MFYQMFQKIFILRYCTIPQNLKKHFPERVFLTKFGLKLADYQSEINEPTYNSDQILQGVPE